jgi:ring-1,2-phenylacetyl-CoA epoxidase subunit PaaC
MIMKLDDALRDSLADQLLAMADDELILGHRNSEWCGHAPILEEDIAFANLALDELGHAIQWYTILAALLDEDLDGYPDQMVYQREAKDFRNIQMVELPIGDWAFSMLRQFLFDAAEVERLERLAESRYAPLAQAAAKIRKEEVYHTRHTRAWVLRLGQGTEESHSRMQAALDGLWAPACQLFTSLPRETYLIKAKITPDPHLVQAAWEASVIPLLQTCGLTHPVSQPNLIDRSQHTSYLEVLVAEMQSIAKLEPQAEW